MQLTTTMGGDIPKALGTHSVVDRMLVHAFPREFLVRIVPLQDLPEDHRTREDVDLVVVLWMRVPELGRLPVDGAYQAPNH